MYFCVSGYLVLRDLGFKVEKYVASEVDEESVTISMVNHDGKITHVDDVKNITKEHVRLQNNFFIILFVFCSKMLKPLCTNALRFNYTSGEESAHRVYSLSLFRLRNGARLIFSSVEVRVMTCP